jgi:hypothetical protein
VASTSAGTAPSLVLNQSGIAAAEIAVPASENALVFKGWNGGFVERLRIDSAGRLLVGTSSAAPSLTADGIGLGTSTGRKIDLYNSTTTHMGLGVDVGGGPYELSIYGPAGTASQGTIRFGFISEGNPGTWTERARIDSSGRVGIGTSSPTGTNGAGYNSLLTVNGNSNTAIDIKDINGNWFIGTTAGSLVAYSQTAGAERLRIDSSGRVGIGTSSPGFTLDCRGTGKFGDAAKGAFLGVDVNIPYIQGYDSTGTYNQLKFITGAAEAMRIDSSGRLLVGTSTARSSATQSLAIQNEGTSFGTTGFASIANRNDIYGAYIHLSKTRGTSNGSSTIVQSGDILGAIQWAGADGLDVDSIAASFECQVDGTPGANDMPGRLVFGTTADGASTPTERMRIDSSGRLLVGTVASITNLVAGGVQIVGNDADAHLAITRFNSAAAGAPAALILGRSRSSTKGTNTTVAAGDMVGSIRFSGADGTSYIETARISSSVDGTPGLNDMPGNLLFSTTSDGANIPTGRMLISSTGAISTVIPGDSTLYPAFDARAWVKFTGTGTVAIGGSGNVSSITDVNVGVYNVNFTTAMPDTEYCTIVTGQQAMARGGGNDASGLYVVNIGTAPVTYTTSSVGVSFQDSGGTGEDTNVACVAVFR